MPAVDTVLLPLCVGLTLLGIIATGVAWRRGNRGRVVQGVGLALAPIALYFSGLLRLLWNGIVAVGTWASTMIFSPAIWFGMALLALCVVLWVVGGIVARAVRAARQGGGRQEFGGCAAGQGHGRQTPRSSRRWMRRWPRSRPCSSPAASSRRPFSSPFSGNRSQTTLI